MNLLHTHEYNGTVGWAWGEHGNGVCRPVAEGAAIALQAAERQLQEAQDRIAWWQREQGEQDAREAELRRALEAANSLFSDFIVYGNNHDSFEGVDMLAFFHRFNDWQDEYSDTFDATVAQQEEK